MLTADNQLDKSMDVLKTAAGNEGLAGLMMQSGIGAGMGLMMGAQLGQQAGSMMTQMPPAQPVATPIPSAPTFQYFVAVNGQQAGPFALAVLQQMQMSGTFSAASMVWRQGIAEWQTAGSLPELVQVFAASAPPPLPPPMPQAG